MEIKQQKIEFEHIHKETQRYKSLEGVKAELFDILINDLKQPEYDLPMLIAIDTALPELVIDQIVVRSFCIFDDTRVGEEEKMFKGRIRYHLKPRNAQKN